MSVTSRRELLCLLGAGLVGGLASRRLHAGETGSPETRPPNIIVVFADDLGYGDLGCYGSPRIKTPHLDRMASEGIRFTDFYCSAPICSPSRAGLLTGRYHVRMGINTVFFPNSTDGLDQSELTVARLLRDRGYATACIGKWHLGHLPQFLPTRHGFDYYYGVPYSNDMEVTKRGDPPLPLMRNEEIIEQPADQDTLTRRYAEEAAQFIGQHRDSPFFIYLAHNMPHVPLHVSGAFAGKSAGGLYGDVIEEMDWGMGRIFQALQEAGVDKNTLVMFTSDNGPWLVKGEHGGSAGILREGKGATFEGGMRVPCLMRWPERIAPGRVEKAPACTLDMLPTFLGLAGGSLPTDRAYDGVDIGPLLFGESTQGHEEFFYFHQGRLQAFRMGPWKLKRAFSGNIYGKPLEHPEMLFDLREDPGEQHDLAEAHPDLVNTMREKMSAFEASLQPLPPDKK